MGGQVSGWIEVAEQSVHIHVLLPWLLAKLAGRLRPQIQGEVRRVLELPNKSPHENLVRAKVVRHA